MTLPESYKNRLQELAEMQNEAFIGTWVPNKIFKMLGIDSQNVTKLGEGDNGIAFKYNDKTIKISYDFAEAEFAASIKGHNLSRVANVYEVYEYDTGEGEDNRASDQFSRSRYYWVIIKEFIPHKFGGDYTYFDALRYFDDYQEKNGFDYSETAFDNMIQVYKQGTIEFMEDKEEYDPDEDYELEDTLRWFEIFKELHMELNSFGILSVSDMKSSNMGFRDDGEPVYLELHIYKTTKGYKNPTYKPLYFKKAAELKEVRMLIREAISSLFESLDVKNYETFYHQTDAKSAESIIKNGFNTPEVWAAPDDEGSYGDVVVTIYAPEPKKPFIMDIYQLLEMVHGKKISYEKAQEIVKNNRKFYMDLGGEVNPGTFDKLRELGYDVVIEDNGDRTFLYPETLKYELEP